MVIINSTTVPESRSVPSKLKRATINAHREGYAPDQIASTMTVGELIEFLNNFDEDEKVYLSHDNGYTYGGITASRFEEVEEETENE